MTTFPEIIQNYGNEIKNKLSGPGEREALITEPVSNLVSELGKLQSLNVTAHNEVRALNGIVRPDFGVRVNGVLTGYIELKAPGKSLDPSTYGKTSHDGRQWQRLKELPNLLHTNGIEWRLWRYGELVEEPVHLHASDLATHVGKLTSPPRLELIVSSFLNWEPMPITTVKTLVDTLGSMAVMLRQEVVESLKKERKNIKMGEDKNLQPFLGLAKDWRNMLFPRSTDQEFADRYAQTVVFSLLLAISDGTPVSKLTLHEVSKKLESNHRTLMGRSLNLLTEHIDRTPVGTAIEMITRTLGAAKWDHLSSHTDDLYLHLYEHFLAKYDPQLRKKTGSYYTPIEVVDGMVRLTDIVLREIYGKPKGLNDPTVSMVDPAMGTGTYPLSLLRRIGNNASKELGPGAKADAVTDAVERLYGIELQSGPFSVAELRVSGEIQELGGEIPTSGLNLYVADTLEDPNSKNEGQGSYGLRMISRQRSLANEMKRDTDIQVVIGNPPYAERAGGKGGWIESGYNEVTGSAPLDDFRSVGNGRTEFSMSNLYVYFWRWATWKAFESTETEAENPWPAAGVVNYITALGYLTGPGFRGMRQYLRENTTHGWIINLTPEGKFPPAKSAIFDIETPVGIGIFCRRPDCDTQEPSEIRYIEISGTKDEKLKRLSELTFDDSGWRPVGDGWQDVFMPRSSELWTSFPKLEDLMPWRSSGSTPNRNWVISPSQHSVRNRLQELFAEDDTDSRNEMFKSTDTRWLSRSNGPAAVEAFNKDRTSLNQTRMITDPRFERITFRSFDRQWALADNRFWDRPRAPLWNAWSDSQVYIVEQHSINPKVGPGLYFSALVPDINAFNNRGGRAYPLYGKSGAPNVEEGVLEVIAEHLGTGVDEAQFVFYVAGIVGHSGFVERFRQDLDTPGIRIPLTSDAGLWSEAVELGKLVVSLHTFGSRGDDCFDSKDIASSLIPSYSVSVGRRRPGSYSYSAERMELRVGNGVWVDVVPDVMEYRIGNMSVVDSWIKYRLSDPSGKVTSPLDLIHDDEWPSEWSLELTELLRSLSRLVDIEVIQADLLSRVIDSDLISVADMGLEV